MHHIALVKSDADWEALYVDGQIQLQNHSLDLGQVLTLVAELEGPIQFENIYINDADEIDYYPDTLDQVRLMT
jgi:hypothetical protein